MSYLRFPERAFGSALSFLFSFWDYRLDFYGVWKGCNLCMQGHVYTYDGGADRGFCPCYGIVRVLLFMVPIRYLG